MLAICFWNLSIAFYFFFYCMGISVHTHPKSRSIVIYTAQCQIIERFVLESVQISILLSILLIISYANDHITNLIGTNVINCR